MTRMTPNQRAALAHGKAAAACAAAATAWSLAAKTSAAVSASLSEYCRLRARDFLVSSLRYAAHAIAYASGAVTAGRPDPFAYHRESPTLEEWSRELDYAALRDGGDWTATYWPESAWPRRVEDGRN